MLLRLLLLALAPLLSAQTPWWRSEPIRWVQTNLRQTDATLDPARLAAQLAEMHANAWLQGMGGIAAYYPTQVEFHYPSPDLPPGRDLFADSLREAHSRHIRVIGRFDFSKTRKAVYDAHPEWFFRQANGEPAVYNGLYSTCINGGYYRQKALEILTEALTRYDVDGLFFNMFGNQSRDYSGRELGLCHCGECARRYKTLYNKELPLTPDEDYRQFMLRSSLEVAAEIGALIHRLRPNAGYFNYIQQTTDGIMSESNTALARPLPLWPYAASLNVNRARSSQPNKASVDLNMQFVDYWWRFSTVSAHEIALRAYQHLAHGGALTYEVNGTLDQQDRQGLEAIRPIFAWAATHEKHFVGQENAARVLLLGSNSDSFRGLFRLLSEQHIPFLVSDNLDLLAKRPIDLVISAGATPAALKGYVERGGRLLIASATPPAFEVATIVKKEKDLRGYLRIRDRNTLPSLGNTDLLLLQGPFTELQAEPGPLTLIPPSLFAPPEYVHIDLKDTQTPALVRKSLGQGRIDWLPWELGALYHRLSLPAHANLFKDLLDQLLPQRQLRTNAHPLVETTLLRRGEETQLHLVNLSGHSQTAYFPPIPMAEIRVTVEGVFRSARALRANQDIPLRRNGNTTELTLPCLEAYELVVLH